MKTNLPLSALVLTTLCVALLPTANAQTTKAADDRVVIVKEDFDRSGLEGGKHRWKTNDGRALRTSKVAKADFQPQVKVVDNTLQIIRTEGSDHAATAKTDASFKNALVSFRFQLQKGHKFRFNMNDPKLKTVHAGHICSVEFANQHVLIQDQKDGNMDLKFRKQREEEKWSKEEQAKRLKGTLKKTKVKIKPDQWHDVELKLVGDRIDIKIDGKPVASFASSGFAHPTKENIALSVPKSLQLDDLKIWSLTGSNKAAKEKESDK